MAEQTYTVRRQHLGDRMYMPDEERTAEPGDVRHLVDKGVLELKAEKPVQNKAAKPPQNKAG